MIIEKTQSNERPANYWLDKLHNGDVIIYIPDNIEEVEEGFEFDLFKYRTRWTENLVERLETQFDEFKTLARKQTLKVSVEKKITALKAELQKTDYKALKFAEGFISPGDYEPIKQYRNNLRLEINNLENIGE